MLNHSKSNRGGRGRNLYGIFVLNEYNEPTLFLQQGVYVLSIGSTYILSFGWNQCHTYTILERNEGRFFLNVFFNVSGVDFLNSARSDGGTDLPSGGLGAKVARAENQE